MELTIGGWIFLVSVWVIVGGVCAYCLYKVIFARRPTDTDRQSSETA